MLSKWFFFYGELPPSLQIVKVMCYVCSGCLLGGYTMRCFILAISASPSAVRSVVLRRGNFITGIKRFIVMGLKDDAGWIPRIFV